MVMLRGVRSISASLRRAYVVQGLPSRLSALYIGGVCCQRAAWCRQYGRRVHRHASTATACRRARHSRLPQSPSVCGCHAEQDFRVVALVCTESIGGEFGRLAQAHVGNKPLAMRIEECRRVCPALAAANRRYDALDGRVRRNAKVGLSSNKTPSMARRTDACLVKIASAPRQARFFLLPPSPRTAASINCDRRTPRSTDSS